MRYISLYTDHPKAGCGMRSFFVVHEGKKKTRLFSPFDVQTYVFDNDDVRKAKDVEIADRKAAAKIATVIRDNYRQHKRMHLIVSGNDAKAVIDDLRKVAA